MFSNDPLLPITQIVKNKQVWNVYLYACNVRKEKKKKKRKRKHIRLAENDFVK